MDWQHMFAITRGFVKSRFFIVHFTITGAWKIVRYNEDLLI